MTQASDPTRLDRLEALADTTLLAIRELSHRHNELSDRQDRTQSQLDELRQQAADSARRQEAIDRQIAANSEQIALNTAGLVELRNIVADFIRAQQSNR